MTKRDSTAHSPCSPVRVPFAKSKLIVKSTAAILTFLSFAAGAQVANDDLKIDTAPPDVKDVDYYIPPLTDRFDMTGDEATIQINRIELIEAYADNGRLKSRPLSNSEAESIISNAIKQNDSKFSFDSLQTVADRISLAIRSQGVLLATAYIPEQNVSNGVVKIAVLKGTLGGVEVTNNELYDKKIYQSNFDPLIGKVIEQNEAEAALALLQNTLPGARVVGVFSPGETVGSSNLNIDVRQEDVISGLTFVDNYGSEATGELRLGVSSNFNNLTGLTDTLTVNLLSNETPEGQDGGALKCCYGGFRYEAKGDNLKSSVGVEYFRSQFDLGNIEGGIQLATIGISGESEKVRYFATYLSDVDRFGQQQWQFAISHTAAESIRFNESTQADELITYDSVSELSVGYGFVHRESNSLDSAYGNITVFYEPKKDSTVSSSIRYLTFQNDEVPSGNPSRTYTGYGEGNYESHLRTTLNLGYNYVTKYGLSLLTSFQGQYSADRLVAVQQFNLTGPFAVRAYPVGAYLSDKGAIGSIDVRYRILSKLTISAFFDAGIAWNNGNEFDPRTEVKVSGAGLALRGTWNNFVLSASAAYAIGVGENDRNLGLGGKEAVSRKTPQMYFNLGYKF